MTGESRLLKEQEVGGGFSPERYIVERRWATAPDGARVPMALLYRRDLVRDGSAPALLYGYGSLWNSDGCPLWGIYIQLGR